VEAKSSLEPPWTDIPSADLPADFRSFGSFHVPAQHCCRVHCCRVHCCRVHCCRVHCCRVHCCRVHCCSFRAGRIQTIFGFKDRRHRVNKPRMTFSRGFAERCEAVMQFAPFHRSEMEIVHCVVIESHRTRIMVVAAGRTRGKCFVLAALCGEVHYGIVFLWVKEEVLSPAAYCTGFHSPAEIGSSLSEVFCMTRTAAFGAADVFEFAAAVRSPMDVLAAVVADCVSHFWDAPFRILRSSF